MVYGNSVQENHDSDCSLPLHEMRDDTSSTAGAWDFTSMNGQICGELTRNPCPLAETSNLQLLTGQPCTFNRTIEEPLFKVPFSESIIFRDISFPFSSEDQSYGQAPSVLQNPKQKSDKVSTDLSETTCSSGSVKSDESFEDSAELVGCYLHPCSILSVQLRVNEGKIYVCTFCGSSKGVDGLIFLYQIPIKTNLSCPSFLGYTSVMISSLANTDNQRVCIFLIYILFLAFLKSEAIAVFQIPVEICGFQLTPKCEYLVLSNYIKVPSCRWLTIHILS